MSFDGIPGTPGTKMVPPEVGQQHLVAWCETTLPGLLLRFEDLAQDSFMVGPQLSWADICVFNRLNHLLDMNADVWQRDFPNLQEVYESVEVLPPIQAKGAVFTAHVVPSRGGATGWTDMRAAYEALDATMRERITDLAAYHSLRYSQAKIGHTPQKGGDYAGYGLDQDPPLRPLVKTHPETQRQSLLIGRHAYGIPGLAEDESEALLQELLEFACQPPRIHHHHWAPGDAVVWDNRRLMHQSTPWPMHEPRLMYHARIAGDQLSEFAAPA